jgi:hypothetical protein
MAKRPQGASLWYCDAVCKTTIRVNGRPDRLRCQRCRKWLTFVKEVAHGER